MERRDLLRAATALATGAALARPGLARAAAFPSRPVTIVVPFPPGGSTDVAARSMADRMAPILGQPVLVENKPGAQTIIGAEAVSRAAPDGHTLLMSSGTTLTLNPLLPERLPYRPEDFAPVMLVSKLPFAVAVKSSLPKTIPDFVALAKSQPGKLNYGSNGPTSFNNIAAIVAFEGMGIQLTEVTYRGDAQQLTDLLGGTLDAIVVGGSSGLNAHRSGRAHIIGWTGDQRVAATPEIPTFSEFGPNMVAQTWFGLLAPARTPPEAVMALNAAARKAMEAQELRDRLLAEAQYAAGGSPEEFATFLRSEMERWRPLVQRLAAAAPR
ncbi:Bug family tripartite tricarboxylate transporter substrate binding protein [Teichococcus cervicalis]|uniref:Tat pathway signal sequence domain protein n=1 Tax=Pseudoroseomonas cervicalis ATCC 49957 TaxID=525371 RepID=D5RPT6_9PROT|nr:tripartite tricarboxylate transporter substrate binding protein [Pseudoroseomonas cervicalis]EFH10685.1 Tat pathway signal sequence domain protein [Pseudoroseomonas cervicalis ATCC 49957]